MTGADSYLFSSIEQLRQYLGQPARVHLTGGQLGPFRQRAQQRQVGLHAAHAAVGQRAAAAAQGVGEVGRGAVHHQLGQQAVEVGRGRGAGQRVRVHPHAGAAGPGELLHAPAGGQRVAFGVQRLGVDAPLDGEAALRHRRAFAQAQLRQRAAGRHLHLQRHQVQPGDGLGHRVFDLQARVGFDEDKGQLGAGAIHQELEGAERAVAGTPRHRQRSLGQLAAQRRREGGAGGDLHQLLEAPLQRAFAHAQADGVLAVAQHLHLDVAGARHQPLDVHTALAEGGLRLGGAALPGSRHLARLRDHAHAAPAAAGNGLDDHAARALRGLLGEEGFGLGLRGGVIQPRHQRHAALGRQRAGARLVAEQRQLLGRGTDEHQPGVGAGLGEGRALGQEAVAGMHCVAALRAGDGDQRRAVQVGGRAGGAQRHGGIGHTGVQRTVVVLREHGHAGHAQVVQRARQPHGDLAAVGDQNLLEQTSTPR